MTEKIFQIDAFTQKPFAGNPAAVCFPNPYRDAAWMQSVAREMNLSETAFLQQTNNGFDLRWFTPTVEVDLCGHATLASAHVLFTEGYVATDKVSFHTRSGELVATKQGDWIELDFPTFMPEEAIPPAGLLEAVGLRPIRAKRISIAYILEVATENEVRSLTPDFTAMAHVSDLAVIVTARSERTEYDFISRFFAPTYGIDEDPVTGSAHCALGPYWMERLGKNEFLAYQASKRGGVVGVKVQGERTKLRGQAVTVLRGELG